MKIHNCHTHIFTINHVPDKFLWFLPIHILVKYKILKWFVNLVPYKYGLLGRLSSFLKYVDEPSQENVLKDLISCYPSDTAFVSLTMDMEYMEAGLPKILFAEQIQQMADLKMNLAYNKILFPFIFADPRRPDITNIVIDAIENKGFQGIKLYPALGYYPFDYRLFPIYDYALRHNIPITTHCIKGVVHYKGDITNEMRIHPVTGERFTEWSNYNFTTHYTDPDNFDILMDKSRLQIYVDKVIPGTKAPDYRNLKINLGHVGGEKEWHNYINGDNSPKNWYARIKDMIPNYPNLYADISYTLSDHSYNILSLLKDSVNDKQLKDRILFGTDFFLVAKADDEKDFLNVVRDAIGEEAFAQIADINARRFLNL